MPLACPAPRAMPQKHNKQKLKQQPSIHQSCAWLRQNGFTWNCGPPLTKNPFFIRFIMYIYIYIKHKYYNVRVCVFMLLHYCVISCVVCIAIQFSHLIQWLFWLMACAGRASWVFSQISSWHLARVKSTPGRTWFRSWRYLASISFFNSDCHQIYHFQDPSRTD